MNKNYSVQTKKAYSLYAYQVINAFLEHELSCTDYISSILERIKKIEPLAKAWVCMHEPDIILEKAIEIDKKLASEVDGIGFLEGIPVGVKDIYNTIDFPTCMGSPIWEGFRPGNDARVVTNLRRAGALIPGKTVTAEFAVHHPGPTINPHNAMHHPGTSSTGSAVAVATGMVPVALGSQTSGSTIRPASYNGVYGYKPSFGSIPRTGSLKTLDTLDHVTCFSRTPEDLSLIFNVMRVRGPNYPLIELTLDQKENMNFEDKDWKVAFLHAPTWDQTEAYTKKALDAYAEKIASTGIIVERAELPPIFHKAHKTHDYIYSKALSYYFKEEYEKHKDLVSPIMRKMIEHGSDILLDDYMWHLEEQNKFSHDLEKFFSDYDIILTHSTAGQAPKLEADEPPDTSLIWTMCRAPAINLPLFKGPEGLPFGAQIVANRYNDYELLAFTLLLKSHGLLSDIEPVGVTQL